jgi:hypothetical protein
VTDGSITQPAGLTCRARGRGSRGLLACSGARIEAGQRVIGKVTLTDSNPCSAKASLTAFLFGYTNPDTSDNTLDAGPLGACPAGGGGGPVPPSGGGSVPPGSGPVGPRTPPRTPACSKGLHYDASQRKCVANRPGCKRGFTYKAKRRKCVANKPKCRKGSGNNGKRSCRKVAGRPGSPGRR